MKIKSARLVHVCCRLPLFVIFLFTLIPVTKASLPGGLKPYGAAMQDKNLLPVQGKVVNNKSEPLAGVSVSIKGSSTGTFTAEDGSYSINANNGDTLVFTAVGYMEKEARVDASGIINITLGAKNENLQEVVVVGYGTQKKENLTGAVSQVKMSEVLGDRPVINTTSALQGTIPGLQITRNSTPGQNANSINIRGTLSINGGDPLVLIDNVPGDIGMVNPDDIETVSVLKDAASAAIYGARAAGGVIIITTKRPKSGARFQLNYNNNFGFEKSINLPQQAPLLDYLSAYQAAGFSDKYWANSQSVTKWMDYLKKYQADPGSFKTVGDGIFVDTDGAIYYLNEKNLYNNFLTKGFLQSHNISVSGGRDNVRYRMSGGYDSEDGPLITNKDFYKRLNIGAFVSADLKKWFTQEVDLRYTQATKNLPGDEVGGIYSLRLISYYPEGNIPADLSLAKQSVPFFTPRNILLNSQTSKLITTNPRIYLKSIFKPLNGLEGVFEYTYNKNDNDYAYYSGRWMYSTVQLANSQAPTTDYLLKQWYYTDYNAFNAYLTYRHSFGDHNIKVMGGAAQEQSYYEFIGDRAENQAVVSVPSFGGATGAVVDNDNYSEYSLRSLFYRVNYNFRDKYLLEFNGRYDGSSKFPPHSRWGFFPSVSVGWQVLKENFAQGLKPFFTELKLRGSYGSIGNQNIAPYQFTPQMAVVKSNVWAALQDRVTLIGVPGLVSDNFTWETVTSTDAGLDMAMFRSRLRAEFDWYQRDTRNMLSAGIELPATVGAPAPLQNIADMRTRGFELNINWADRIGDFGYRLGFNLYNSKSKITRFITNKSNLLSNWYVGQTLGEIWGYVADGYYSVNDFQDVNSWKLKDGVTGIKGYNVKPGDMKFVNLKDDANSANLIDAGVNTLDNPGDRRVIGNSLPQFQYGGTLGISYKGIDLSALVQGVARRDYWLGGQAIFPFAGSGATDAVFQPLYYNQTDYWTPKSTDPASPDYMVPVNANAKYFRIYDQMGNVGSNTRVSDKYLQNAAYLRIKNITLGYALAPSLLRRIKFNGIKVFVSVENPATFTRLPKGADPENLRWSYPFYTTTSFGINVNL